MPSFRDVIVFLAGAEFFHTLSHIFINYYIVLPLSTKLIVLTPRMNLIAITVNAIITFLLLWWASKLKK